MRAMKINGAGQMALAVEKVVQGRCYRGRDKVRRKVLLIQGKRVTFIIRGDSTWTVLRYYQDVNTFAEGCEAEIDCATLEDIP
jgi:hypothetical protein